MIFHIILAIVGVSGMILFWWNGKNNIAQDVSSPHDPSHRISGTLTQIESGKDGVQVESETENGHYNVMISITQTEIEGDFAQIKIGADIEVTGQLLDGMAPSLIVAEKVTVLEHED